MGLAGSSGCIVREGFGKPIGGKRKSHLLAIDGILRPRIDAQDADRRWVCHLQSERQGAPQPPSNLQRLAMRHEQE
jgi:hypothetical protein